MLEHHADDAPATAPSTQESESPATAIDSKAIMRDKIWHALTGGDTTLPYARRATDAAQRIADAISTSDAHATVIIAQILHQHGFMRMKRIEEVMHAIRL